MNAIVVQDNLAEEWYSMIDSLGEGHASTLMGMANPASTYCKQRRLIKAKRVEVRVMGAGKIVLDLEYASILSGINSPAIHWKVQREIVPLSNWSSYRTSTSATLGAYHHYMMFCRSCLS